MNYENINLTKSMYTNSSKSFSQILEELDPSSEYAGTELEEWTPISASLSVLT